MPQSAVIGAVNQAAGDDGVVVCAAGSMPGDLHKLWRPSGPGSYHVEYGYSCMGYEIAGGLGIKMAVPHREVFVMVGDGSYLMMAQELVTAVAEGVKLTSCWWTTPAPPRSAASRRASAPNGSARRTPTGVGRTTAPGCRWTSPPTPPASAPRCSAPRP